MKTTFFKTFLAFTFSLIAPVVFAQSSITGIVVDENNEPIPGVNIIIQGTSEGTNSDFDGNFTINTNQAFPLNIELSSVGFATMLIEVTNADQALNVSLASGTKLDEIIVSASRRKEKILDAPASVTLITAKEIENSPYFADPASQLVNVPGVQIQQQSANAINIEMRAGSGVFGTSTFPILDYRYLVTPSAGSFLTYQTGLTNIDLAQIEVVRGAASALYGPGVTSGVIHFITKNPIDYPGTQMELFGGTQKSIGGAFRHAEVNDSKTFGWKVNAKFNRGDEFKLDPVVDADFIAGFSDTIYQPAIGVNGVVDASQTGTVLLTRDDLDPDADGNMLANDYQNYAVNAHLEYRPTSNTTAFFAAGLANGNGLFFNSQGAGQTQGNDYWTQARVQSGGLFAQVYYNYNDGGDENNPTYLYSTGFRQVAKRESLEAQIQYNFDIEAISTNLTFGSDYRDTGSESENTLYGRNDANDPYTITGVYMQGTTDLSDKLALTYAGRLDKFNFVDETAFAPRVALVYKANARNTFRASYNVSSFGPSTLETYIDFPVATLAPNILDVWLTGQIEDTTFPNQNIELAAGLGTILPGQTQGIPLGFTNVGTPQQGVGLYNVLGALALPGVGWTNAVVGTLLSTPAAAGLTSFAPDLQAAVDSFVPTGVTGSLSPGFNLFNPTVGISEGIGSNKAEVGYLDSFEVGYKGLIKDKFAVGIDIYTYNRKGFTQFTALGPTYGVVGFDKSDLSTQLQNHVYASVVGKVTQDVNNGIAAIATQGYQDIVNLSNLLGSPITLAEISANGLDAATAAAFAAGSGQPITELPPLAAAIAGAQATQGPALIQQAAGGLAGLAGQVADGVQDGFVASPQGALLSAIGTIESDRVPVDGMTHIPAGYRKFNNQTRSHMGADLSVDYFYTDNITFWGNYSWLDQNTWIPGEADDDGLPFESYLNAPLNKYRLGFRYTGENGFRTSATFQHEDAFESNQGFFGGTVQEKNLVDVSIGRKVGKIQLDLAATNLFNQKYRAFPSMPIIERRVVLKAGFTF